MGVIHDQLVETNIEAALYFGLEVGLYHYVRFARHTEQFNWVCNLYNTYRDMHLPPAIDVEYPSFDSLNHLGGAKFRVDTGRVDFVMSEAAGKLLDATGTLAVYGGAAIQWKLLGTHTTKGTRCLLLDDNVFYWCGGTIGEENPRMPIFNGKPALNKVDIWQSSQATIGGTTFDVNLADRESYGRMLNLPEPDKFDAEAAISRLQDRLVDIGNQINSIYVDLELVITELENPAS